MKKGILLLLLVPLYFLLKAPSLPFLPFDAAMGKVGPTFSQCYKQSNRRIAKRWKRLRSLYHTHLAAKPRPTIPKIIHQIWIGGPLPPRYLPLMRTWQERHPDWQYRLWTDDDLPTFPFCNRARFDQAQNIGEKADILRYEILNAYGGLYVDTDFECLAPFDPLHPLADFYVGLEAPFQTDSEPAIGNALIASIPHHPILEELLATIAASPPARDPYAVQCTTGPNALRTAFLHNLTSHRNIALPYTFFYPLPSCKRDLAPQFKTSSYLQKETFAVHYWEATWTSDPFDS